MAEPLRVMASIKPLALMVEELAGDRVEVTTLMKPGQTPHDFAFKVSDRQRLAEADVLIWVGATLEPYLATLASYKTELSMAEVLNITAPQHHNHQHGHRHDHVNGHELDNSHADQHYWLNPVHGTAMVIAIADKLAALDPEHAVTYRQNAERMGQQLLAISAQRLSAEGPVGNVTEPPVSRSRHYAVVHQAFDYFLERFAYAQPMVLTPIPELSPGARQLRQAGQYLAPGDCVLVESRSPSKWVQTFAARDGLKIKHVDIMGFEESVSTYAQLLENVITVFDECAG